MKPDIKKQLETMFGAEAVRNGNFSFSIAVSTISEDVSITRKAFLSPKPNECDDHISLLDVSGYGTTGSDGKSVFRLNDFRCLHDLGFSTPKMAPINVVATPLSSTPCFLTVIHSLLDNGADVEINISTWDASGAAAPDVAFDWRCRAPFSR